MMYLQILVMVVIPIILFALACFFIGKLWDSNLPAWFSAFLLFSSFAFCVGIAIGLDFLLYQRWFA